MDLLKVSEHINLSLSPSKMSSGIRIGGTFRVKLSIGAIPILIVPKKISGQQTILDPC